MCRTRSEHKSNPSDVLHCAFNIVFVHLVHIARLWTYCALCAFCTFSILCPLCGLCTFSILCTLCSLQCIAHNAPCVQFCAHCVCGSPINNTCCILCSILCTLCCSGICVVHYVLLAHRVHHCTLCGCPINYTCSSGINRRLQGFKVSDQAKRNQSKAFLKYFSLH